jgi:glucosyl-3-phosphoglycerate synthase
MPNESVLVIGTSKAEIESLLPFARALAAPLKADIHILGLVAVPEDESLSTGALKARRLRLAIARSARRVGASVVIRVGHDIWDELKKTVDAVSCTLLLTLWESGIASELLRALPCDVIFIKPPFPRKYPRILFPIRGGPYAALALRFALALADSHRGKITVLHSSGAKPTEDSSYQKFLSHLRGLPQIAHWIAARDDAPVAILKAARNHQLLVMGAIAQPRRGESPIGPTAHRVLSKTQLPALVVRSSSPLTALTQRLFDTIPGLAAKMPSALSKGSPDPPPVDFTISVVVDKWFAENTFHAHEFQALKELIKLKEKQGLTISLGLPTLNESKTIGKVIRTAQAYFMRRYPLLDEIVVIDSMSTDRTVEIAESLGVPVFKHPEILPQYGSFTGKGEGLWKSLYVLRGDLIAWIDTDIANISPRFIYGILGPLIREPHLVYVKGFYHRPLRFGGKVEARGGGRVTELAARPLLNLFYPELSGFVQPLAGEYAGRRQALESVPFFAGYGVETGLLIDIWSRYGLQAIGQVDLEERIHRNQSLLALSKMAFEITQVVMQRVGEKRHLELVNELQKSIKLIRYARDEFQLEVADIRARERPPMASIPEYKNRNGNK